MKATAIYYRVSTDQQDVSSQEQAVGQWLAGQPESPIIVVRDLAVSGKRDNRPGLNQIMMLAREGKLDRLVVFRLDRFSRSIKTALRLILELDSLGVTFVSVSEPLLADPNSPIRYVILSVMSMVAELEREAIVGRVKAGLSAAKARGQQLGAKRRVTVAEVETVLSLDKEGKTKLEIEAATGLSARTVGRIISKVGCYAGV